MPWGFALAAAGAIGSALIGANASSSAANAQVAAANAATAFQEKMFNQFQTNEAPYMAAGTNALSALQSGLGLGTGGTGTGPLNAPFTMADFTSSPGYGFQKQEGTNAILNNASAMGGVLSGNTLKALSGYGTGLAAQDYWNAYNAYVARQNQLFGQLDTLASAGQNAAVNLGSAGSQLSTQVGGNLIGAGNARAAGQIASANNYTTGINNLLGLIQSQGNNFFGGDSSASSMQTGAGSAADLASLFSQYSNG